MARSIKDRSLDIRVLFIEKAPVAISTAEAIKLASAEKHITLK